MAKNNREARDRQILILADKEGNLYCVRQDTVERAKVDDKLVQRFKELMDGKEVNGIVAREVSSDYNIVRVFEINPADSSWMVEALRGA